MRPRSTIIKCNCIPPFVCTARRNWLKDTDENKIKEGLKEIVHCDVEVLKKAELTRRDNYYDYNDYCPSEREKPFLVANTLKIVQQAIHT